MSARSLRITLTTSARRVAAERGGTLFTIAFYVLVTAVISGLWRAAAAARGGAIAGYSGVALTWYLATSEGVTISMNPRLIADIGADVASGTIAVELLRPASVLAHRVATEMGRVLPRLVVCATVGVVLAFVIGGPAPDLPALGLAAPSMVLAVGCNVVAQHAFASAAFWLRDTGATWFLYQKLVFIVGGMLLPLETLPGWLHRTASVLPFQAMAYAPARLASGQWEPHLLLQQVGWMAVLAVVAIAVFGAGERRLQVVGG